MPNSNNNIKPISSIKVQFDTMGADCWIVTKTMVIVSGDKAAWNELVKVDNGRVAQQVKSAIASGQSFYHCGNTFIDIVR